MSDVGASEVASVISVHCIQQATFDLKKWTLASSVVSALITLLWLQDSDVFFDLKKLLEDCQATVPRELATHEAAKAKPGDRPRREQTVYAKH